jgi:hypothetical protein
MPNGFTTWFVNPGSLHAGFFMRWETSTHGEVEQLEAPVLQPRSHGKMVAPWDVIMILGKPALG